MLPGGVVDTLGGGSVGPGRDWQVRLTGQDAGPAAQPARSSLNAGTPAARMQSRPQRSSARGLADSR